MEKNFKYEHFSGDTKHYKVKQMADLTKLVYEKVKDYDIEGAKIFMKKFGDNVKTEHETIKFFIENHLANNDDEAKECLEEMTREIYSTNNTLNTMLFRTYEIEKFTK
jgi:hypothetical protein